MDAPRTDTRPPSGTQPKRYLTLELASNEWMRLLQWPPPNCCNFANVADPHRTTR